MCMTKRMGFGLDVGIDILYKNKTFEWDGEEVFMIPKNYLENESIEAFHEETKVFQDSKYDKINFEANFMMKKMV